MQITLTPQGGAVITGNDYDGYDFATRPGQFWPVSELRHATSGFRIEIDEHADLVDFAGPEATPSNELGAFIEYALIESKHEIQRLLLIERIKQ